MKNITNIKTDEQAQDKKALQLLNSGVTVKYPAGSYISFGGFCDEEDEERIVSCSWYDKIGGKESLKKNRVYSPPEWQNITGKKAEEIAEMFDDSSCTCIVFSKGPKKE